MDDQRTRLAVARALAGAFLDAPAWELRALYRAGADVLGTLPEWLVPVADRALTAFAVPPHPPDRLVAFLVDALPGAEQLPALGRTAPRLPPIRPDRAFPDAYRFGVPPLDSEGELAAWLGLTDGGLAWLADVRSLERSARDEPLRNYRYGWRTRPGGGSVRVIERPKAHLKAVQRHVLHGLLERIPVHPAVHGFVRGRSAVTHACAHVGRRVVLGWDLRDFFATIAVRRVRATFRAVGYPDPVARALAGLCTNALPPRAWASVPRPAAPEALDRHFHFGRLLAASHLPQGAPTSPALANLAARGLDRRLSALARRWDATYTRYADDLVISGGDGLLRVAPRLRVAVETVIRAEGFTRHAAKDHLATDAGRQAVCGITVNVHPNPARGEYDRLKALLHNAARDGPAAHNREGRPDFRAHLQGRVAWVAALNPERGARLQRRLDDVKWST